MKRSSPSPQSERRVCAGVPYSECLPAWRRNKRRGPSACRAPTDAMSRPSSLTDSRLPYRSRGTRMARVRRSHCTPSRPKVCKGRGGSCQAPWEAMLQHGMVSMHTLSPGRWAGSSQAQQGRDRAEAHAGQCSLHEQNADRFGGSSAPCARPPAGTATRSRRHTQRARCSGIRGAMLAAPQIRSGQCRHTVALRQPPTGDKPALQ